MITIVEDWMDEKKSGRKNGDSRPPVAPEPVSAPPEPVRAGVVSSWQETGLEYVVLRLAPGQLPVRDGFVMLSEPVGADNDEGYACVDRMACVWCGEQVEVSAEALPENRVEIISARHDCDGVLNIARRWRIGT